MGLRRGGKGDITKKKTSEIVNCLKDMEAEQCRLNKNSIHFFEQLDALPVNSNQNSIKYSRVTHFTALTEDK